MKNRDTVKTLFLINVTIAFKYTFKKVQKKKTQAMQKTPEVSAGIYDSLPVRGWR